MGQSILPDFSSDCHVHVVGRQDKYPMIETRQYTAPMASVDALKKHMDAVGLQRAVIVQPSFYGVDNRCLLDSLAELNAAQRSTKSSVARGVVVLDTCVTDADLQHMDSLGVRGVRVNVESSHGQDADGLKTALQYWSHRIAAFGWHIQVFASQALIAQCAAVIARLDVAVVLDHFALLPTGGEERTTGLKVVSNLLATGNVWVKLSAPYRLSNRLSKRLSKATEDKEAEFQYLSEQLLSANRDRILWASDWPHTQRENGKAALEESAYRKITDELLGEQILRWCPTQELRQSVLVDNPARLYRFD
jgi:predicted TIM-barrel fold metal-dependent hydrolase